MKIFPSRTRLVVYAAAFALLAGGSLVRALLVAPSGGADDRSDILARRRYLIQRVLEGGPSVSSMHFYLPKDIQGEWAVVTHSMLSAALVNIAHDMPGTRDESLAVIEKLIARMLMPEFSEFDTRAWGEDALTTLATEAGHIGYLGHLNLTLGAYRILGGTAYDSLHREVSLGIERKLRAVRSLNAHTFPGLSWIPDNTAALASLGIFALAQGSSCDICSDWASHARNNLLDSQTGLLVFWLDSHGNALPQVRGSGAGWNSFYLPFIDQALAEQQFLQMKKHLVQLLPLGFAALREWPSGQGGGFGDVDSGPVVFGLSPSGTGFAIAGARCNDDQSLLRGLLRTAELAGMSYQRLGKRRYLIAPLVGDAILLAMRTARTWNRRFIETHQTGSVTVSTCCR